LGGIVQMPALLETAQVGSGGGEGINESCTVSQSELRGTGGWL